MRRIIFLGSGGGRGMIRTQERKTGGIFCDLGDLRFAIDPGPGALVNALALKLQPEKWNGVILSHLHIDHSADANVLIDCMIDGQQCFVLAEKHCLQPKGKNEKIEDYFPCVTAYHQSMSKVYPMEDGKSVKIKNMKVRAVFADHYFPTLGFVISHDGKKIGYTSDGCYYTGMEKQYSGCDLLILNVSIPMGIDAKPHTHMNTGDAIKFLKLMENKPKLVVINHMTPLFMRANIWKQLKILQDATKLRAIICEDSMEINLDTLNVKSKTSSEKEERIMLE